MGLREIAMTKNAQALCMNVSYKAKGWPEQFFAFRYPLPDVSQKTFANKLV